MGIDTLGILIVYFVVVIIVFLICVFIARAVFSIPTIVDNLKEQTRLLTQIEANTNKGRPKTAPTVKPHNDDDDLEREALSYPKE